MRAALLGIVLTACGGCAHVAPYEPAILREVLPPGKGAVTICAENNVPYIVVDSGTQGTDLDLAVIEHERRHAAQAVRYRGGGWPFLYRYRADSVFRVAMELEAYCAWGRWMIAHNRAPDEVWEYIAFIMQTRYGVAVRRNCLYEEGTP